MESGLEPHGRLRLVNWIHLISELLTHNHCKPYLNLSSVTVAIAISLLILCLFQLILVITCLLDVHWIKYCGLIVFSCNFYLNCEVEINLASCLLLMRSCLFLVLDWSLNHIVTGLVFDFHFSSLKNHFLLKKQDQSTN